MSPSLHVVMSGASTVSEPVSGLIRMLAEDGWSINTVVSTPSGVSFHDVEEIEKVTGNPIRVDFRAPGTGKRIDRPDAIVACPWSFNSTNKTATGIADTFAVALLCEMIGAQVPTVVVPKAHSPLADHPAFPASIAALRAMPSVTVLYKSDVRLPTWRDVVAAMRIAGDS